MPATLTFSPNPATVDETVTFTGQGFNPHGSVHLLHAGPDDGQPAGPAGPIYADGTIKGRIIPRAEGKWLVLVIERTYEGLRHVASTQLTVTAAPKAAPAPRGKGAEPGEAATGDSGTLPPTTDEEVPA